MLSDEDYRKLSEIDRFKEGLLDILNRNGCANWTVCPECRVDDFTHVEGCAIGQVLGDA